MSLLLAAMVQAVAPVSPEQIDLTVRQPCEARKPKDGEIVVCARRNDGLSPYRINQASPRQSDIPKAEIRLADGLGASVDTENVDVGGFPSNRVMVRFRIKF